MSTLQEQIAKKKQMEEDKKKKKESTGSFSNDYEDLAYLGLETGKEKVFRILGDPFDYSTLDRKPTDPKLILQSEIVKEERKSYTKINWPIIVKDGEYKPDPTFILTKMYEKVNEGKWIKYPDGKLDPDTGKNGYFEKYHSDKPIFKILGYKQTGNAKEGEKYPKSFFPSKKVVMNVIDRHDTWCKDNKHSKILSSGRTNYNFKDDKGNQISIWYTDTGIAKTAYDKLIEHAVKSTGNLEVDFILIKKGKESTDKYEVWDATDSKYISDETKSITVDGDLSAEEKTYELYDLDKYFPPQSSYTKIKKNLEWLFKKCDGDLGTSFTKELDALCKIEEEEREARKDEEEKNNPKPVETKPEVKEEPKVEEKLVEESSERRRVETPKVEVSTSSLTPETFFPSWNALTDEEKVIMKEVIDEFKDGLPIYNNKGGKIYLCNDENCKYPNTKVDSRYPAKVITCPVCGKKPE